MILRQFSLAQYLLEKIEPNNCFFLLIKCLDKLIHFFSVELLLEFGDYFLFFFVWVYSRVLFEIRHQANWNVLGIHLAIRVERDLGDFWLLLILLLDNKPSKILSFALREAEFFNEDCL